MIKNTTIMLLLLFGIVFPVTGDSAIQENISANINVLKNLYQVALLYDGKTYNQTDRGWYNTFAQDARKGAEEILQPVKDPKTLAQLALLANIVYSPGDAKDVMFDEIFFQAYRACVTRLGKTISKENYRELKRIECHLCLDGGESLLFYEILGQFEASLDLQLSRPENIYSSLDTEKGKNDLTKAEQQEIINRALQSLEEIPTPEKLLTQDEALLTSSKELSILELLNILNALYQQTFYIDENEYTEVSLQYIVEKTIKKTHSPDELGRLAAVAWLLHSSGGTNDNKFSLVFFYTYRECIERLAENPCKTSYLVLEHLRQCQLCLEGEEKEFFEEKLNYVASYLKEVEQ